MRSLISSTLLIALTAISVQARSAPLDDYPSRSLKWIVTGAPGDGSDIVARMVADKLAQVIGQPVVIDNKPGAGGVLGSEIAARAAPDGYTFIVGNAGSHGVNAAIYHKLRYSVVDDFAPVSLFCTTSNVLVVNQTVKAKTVPELVAYSKKSPSKLFYASGGVGSSAHMVGELFKSATGIEITHVPYKGSTPAVLGVVGNEAQMMLGNLPPWLDHIKSGRVRALAVSSTAREKALPDVPTFAEYYPGFEAIAWYGLLAPKGVSPKVVSTLNAAIEKVLEDPDLKRRLLATSCEPAAGSPESFRAMIARDVTRWKKLANEKHIVVD